jgi:diadenosine tetraphosphate (Ap4A) HIT family hydrolase
MNKDCLVCRKHQGLETLWGGVIYEDKLIYISHAQLWGEETDHYLGHIIIEPKRHSPLLSDLNREEAEVIGYYTSLVAKALVETEGAEHVYSFVLGHHVSHLHVHVIARYPGAPREYWGTRVDDWPDAPRGGEAEISQAAERIRAFMAEQAKSG